MKTDTIFATATAPGKAGVSIVRISGDAVPEILSRLGAGECPARRACLRDLKDEDGGVIDSALVLRFEPGASFTGEAVAELQLHGSLAVQRAILARLGGLGLCRLAQPGEFTRRALENGRLDLTEVQGLADLIDAETEEQRRAAMRVFNGALSQKVTGWRETLIHASALLEAVIDFADEEVPEDVTPEVEQLLSGLLSELMGELSGSKSARSLRNGFEIAVLGHPNAGKSSFINMIANDDVAIVSDIPGTTRDTLEVPIDLGGIKVRFIDTAGLRSTEDEIERLGIDRARSRAGRADLRLYLHEEPELPPIDPAPRSQDLLRRTKSDKHGDGGLSSVTRVGVDDLLDEIRSRIEDQVETAGLVSRDRDIEAIQSSVDILEFVLATLSTAPVEMSAHRLLEANSKLQRIVGAIDSEDVLDAVFRSFCMGK
jgi:tRNA modification GTPase